MICFEPLVLVIFGSFSAVWREQKEREEPFIKQTAQVLTSNPVFKCFSGLVETNVAKMLSNRKHGLSLHDKGGIWRAAQCTRCHQGHKKERVLDTVNSSLEDRKAARGKDHSAGHRLVCGRLSMDTSCDGELRGTLLSTLLRGLCPPGGNRGSKGHGLSQEGRGSLIPECGLLSECTLQQEVILLIYI